MNRTLLSSSTCLLTTCSRKKIRQPLPSNYLKDLNSKNAGYANQPNFILLGVPNTHERIRHDQDRMALIAFADGMQQVTLPRYYN